jgi:hypothetical protein
MSSIILTQQEIEEVKSAYKDVSWIESCLAKPVEQIMISYYYKAAGKKFDRQIFIYLNNSSWSYKIVRTKMHLQYLTIRKGTRTECIDEHFRYRMKFLIYNHWEDLLSDELQETGDQVFIDSLKEFIPKYPLAKKTGQTSLDFPTIQQ